MILALLKAARPVTLIVSICPVIVGATLAHKYDSQIDLFILCLTLSAALLLQAGSNLLNDALDFKRGADTKNRIGPSRASQSGILSYKAVFASGFFCLVLAMLCGIPLVLHGGFLILLIGITAIIFAYTYTGGPFPLAYNGLGEVFAILYYGIIAVIGTTYLFMLEIPFEAWFRGIQTGLFASALIALNNFRDINQDREANKNTLAVKYGSEWQKKLLNISLYTPLFMEILRSYWDFNPLIVISLVSTTLIAKRTRNLSPSKECNKFLGQITLSELTFTCSFVISTHWIKF